MAVLSLIPAPWLTFTPTIAWGIGQRSELENILKDGSKIFLMSVVALSQKLNGMRTRYSMRYVSKQMSHATAPLRFCTFLLSMN